MPSLRSPRSTRCVHLLGVWLLAAALLPAAPSAQSELVIHVQGTKLYHRPGCPDLGDSKNVLAMTRAQAESRGYKQHETCDPANPDAPRAAGRSAAPVTVYLDGSRYYHRSTCSRLPDDEDEKKKKVKAASLEVAGKSHWPCPTCKPPVRKRSAEPAVPGTERRGR
jgi:hypothetical protein